MRGSIERAHLLAMARLRATRSVRPGSGVQGKRKNRCWHQHCGNKHDHRGNSRRRRFGAAPLCTNSIRPNHGHEQVSPQRVASPDGGSNDATCAPLERGRIAIGAQVEGQSQVSSRAKEPESCPRISPSGDGIQCGTVAAANLFAGLRSAARRASCAGVRALTLLAARWPCDSGPTARPGLLGACWPKDLGCTSRWPPLSSKAARRSAKPRLA